MDLHGRSQERSNRLRRSGWSGRFGRIGGRTALRYWLLQIPGTVLLAAVLLTARRWVTVSWWLIASILGVWIAKDAVLFPWLWEAYDWDAPGTTNTLHGATGSATEKLDPSGWVSVRGELWQATVEDGAGSVESGQRVRVQDVRGLTVVVTPCPPTLPEED